MSNRNTKRYMVGFLKSARELREMTLEFKKVMDKLERELEKYTDEDINKMLGDGKSKLTTPILDKFSKELVDIDRSLEDSCPLAARLRNLRLMVDIEYESRFADKE